MFKNASEVTLVPKNILFLKILNYVQSFVECKLSLADGICFETCARRKIWNSGHFKNRVWKTENLNNKIRFHWPLSKMEDKTMTVSKAASLTSQSSSFASSTTPGNRCAFAASTLWGKKAVQTTDYRCGDGKTSWRVKRGQYIDLLPLSENPEQHPQMKGKKSSSGRCIWRQFSSVPAFDFFVK
jgi:hypothetical protein